MAKSQMTKKELALSLHAAGRSVEEIARALHCAPSYVANTLIAAGKKSEYSDLYTNSISQNEYARQFNGVLRFTERVEANDNNIVAFRRSNRLDSAKRHQIAPSEDRLEVRMGLKDVLEDIESLVAFPIRRLRSDDLKSRLSIHYGMKSTQPRISRFVARNALENRDAALPTQGLDNKFTREFSSFEIIGPDEGSGNAARLL